MGFGLIITTALFSNKYSPPTALLLCCVHLEIALAAYQWELGGNKRSAGIFVSQSHHLSFCEPGKLSVSAEKRLAKLAVPLELKGVTGSTAEVMQ